MGREYLNQYNMKECLAELMTKKKDLDKDIEILERRLAKKIQFENYSIFYQQGDGFVLGFQEHNAPLYRCLAKIEQTGKLTLEDYLRLCI
jgi:hypothetical protein